MTGTRSLNLDAIDCLEVRTVPKEELVLFAEPEAVKEGAPNEVHRRALTDAMRGDQLVPVRVPRRRNVPAAGRNASALLAVRLR
jgi:hypothetical protein